MRPSSKGSRLLTWQHGWSQLCQAKWQKIDSVEIYVDDGIVLDFDFCYSYIKVYWCQHSKNCTLERVGLLHVNYTPIKRQPCICSAFCNLQCAFCTSSILPSDNLGGRYDSCLHFTVKNETLNTNKTGSIPGFLTRFSLWQTLRCWGVFLWT